MTPLRIEALLVDNIEWVALLVLRLDYGFGWVERSFVEGAAEGCALVAGADGWPVGEVDLLLDTVFHLLKVLTHLLLSSQSL